MIWTEGLHGYVVQYNNKRRNSVTGKFVNNVWSFEKYAQPQWWQLNSYLNQYSVLAVGQFRKNALNYVLTVPEPLWDLGDLGRQYHPLFQLDPRVLVVPWGQQGLELQEDLLYLCGYSRGPLSPSGLLFPGDPAAPAGPAGPGIPGMPGILAAQHELYF